MEAGTKPPSDSCWPLHAHRELAYQIAEQFRVLGKPLGLKDCIIVGGMGMGEPKEALGMGLLHTRLELGATWLSHCREAEEGAP